MLLTAATRFCSQATGHSHALSAHVPMMLDGTEAQKEMEESESTTA